MQMTDLIAKKRDGGVLTTEEIDFIVKGFTNGTIPDYQMSAMCMAIVFRSMNERETLDLTLAMMNSGEKIDLSAVNGIKVDKHSTGGVGDKTSLVLCPLAAACGLKVAKLSGRGLGHTGGTIDKLESFPGFITGLSEDEFIDNVNTCGIAIAGQTADIDPADKKLYALRDVTGTVPSIPLIVSSIMSKKLAAGSDIIVLDVKTGSGAFMKTEEQAKALARELTRVGRLAGKKCVAIVTDMDQPLGHAIGNSIEVKEAISVLKGEAEGDLLVLCLALGAQMLIEAGMAEDRRTAAAILKSKIADGSALEKLADMVEAQGGSREDVFDTSRLPDASIKLDVIADRCGYVKHIDAEKIGLVSMHLGGGRVDKLSRIDLAVGVWIDKKVSDRVETGDVIGTIHASDMKKAEEAAEMLKTCYTLSDEPTERSHFIKATIRSRKSSDCAEIVNTERKHMSDNALRSILSEAAVSARTGLPLREEKLEIIEKIVNGELKLQSYIDAIKGTASNFV